MLHQNRLDWVDIAKALSITLVVMMYATYSSGEATGMTGFMHWLVAFATPLRMPEFFLISGLFLSRTITRDWRSYADKRVVHYLYFFALWTLILITLKVGVISTDPKAAFIGILSAPITPYSALWFIYALALFSIAAKLLHDLKVPVWLVLLAGAALNLAPFSVANDMQNFFGELADYFVFFMAGYVFAPRIFALVQSLIAKPLLGIGVLAVWAVINGLLVFTGGFELGVAHTQMGWAANQIIRLPLAFSGALAICVAAGLLSLTRLRTPLAYMGARVLMIYLSFLIPMAIAREAIMKIGIADTGTISLLIIISAIIGPLIAEAVIAKIGWGRFLFTRPQWAHLKPTAVKSETASVPAQ